MVTRLRRLEGLLGGRLNDVDYSSTAELVGNTDAAEGEDLDYKREHYDSGDEGGEELAKDVAAFANHTGGLLILGMAESKGVPSRVFDVDLDDRHLRHIRQVIATNTAPMVPYEAIPVHNPDTHGTGLLLLAVPRSPHAPHAVTARPTKLSRAALRYPRRGGSQNGSPRRMWPPLTGPGTRHPRNATSVWPMSKRNSSTQWPGGPHRI